MAQIIKRVYRTRVEGEKSDMEVLAEAARLQAEYMSQPSQPSFVYDEEMTEEEAGKAAE